jgi:thiol-disulfide isomerase/thioredoxin
MTRTVLAALFLLATPSFVLCQDTPAAPQDPKAAYDELVKAFNKAISEWQTEAQAAVEKAKAEGARQLPAILMNPPTKEFIAKAQEYAQQYEGKDEAVPFLGFVLKYARTERNAVKKAIETLATTHTKSAAIADVLPFVPNGMRMGAKNQVMQLLDDVAQNHGNAECKAQALITRGSLKLGSAQTDEDRKAAEQDLRAVAGITKDADLLAQAKDALFEIENLQVGCTAPDITGVDVEGAAFKLSDYRGKVVLLDFWGFW